MMTEKTVKILTIDDEPFLRNSIVAYLEDSGFETCEADNGQSGLAAFEAEKPDLVLTDLQMPQMDGLQVLEEIKKRSAQTPVIVISGAGGMKDVIQALRCGAWDYITKPISDLAFLEHTICKCLEQSRLVLENESYRKKIERNLAILEADQKAGRNVQLRLLPENHQNFSGYRFHYSFTPSLYLSGDFLDFFEWGEKHICFYLADVSGHGASSAFVTVLLKSLINRFRFIKLQANTKSVLLDPNALLQAINEEIYKVDLGKYLTMVYGVINIEQNTLDYVLAGHYPPPILVQSQGAGYLKSSGFPIGIQKTVQYPVLHQKLPDQFCLSLYSDGVLELITDQRSTEAKELKLLALTEQEQGDVSVITKQLKIQQQHNLPDDITILTIQKT